MGTFDRFSAIIVPHEGRCAIQSVVASDPPPRKHKDAPKDAPQDADTSAAESARET